MTATLLKQLSALEALRVNVITGRARARLSQQELADKSGVSRATVSRIERAAVDPGVTAVQRIADALGLAVSELFIPASNEPVDDIELAARFDAGDDEFVDARDLLDALDEAAERPPERYSRAGRPPVAR